jgi:syntenin-1
MSLYPSLEDMKVDQTVRAQLQAYDAIAQHQNNIAGIPSAPPLNSHSPINSPVYPDLIDYMGLELSQDMIAANMPEYIRRDNQQLATYTAPSMPNNMIAPLSGNSAGLVRAGTTTNGIRELILCKGRDGKVGLRAQSINKGIFVCMVSWKKNVCQLRSV